MPNTCKWYKKYDKIREWCFGTVWLLTGSLTGQRFNKLLVIIIINIGVINY